MHVMDYLSKKIAEKDSRVCVGLDPTDLPQMLLDKHGGNRVAAIIEFCKGIIISVKDYAVAVKPNIAYYEAEGALGYAAYEVIAQFAKEQGMFVIGDVKRADIGKTSEAYAKAYLGSGSPYDMITINPYFGTDGVMPFINMAKANDKGVYILVKTSNKSSHEIQDSALRNGSTVFEDVATYTELWGENLIGDSNYSLVGAVVGATYPEQAAILRAKHPKTPFLVPGYGSQGATANDVAMNFSEDGLGALVNASSSIVYAYKKGNTEDYVTAAAQETLKMRDAINAVLFS